jgi:hypothetical protein
MEPEDRVKLVERHKVCLGCLTSGHGRTARSCPYKEERVDAMQSQTPPSSTLEETSDEGQPGRETPCQANRRGYGSDANGGARIRGAASRSMGQHQRRRALLSLLGHGLTGDPHYPQRSPSDEAASHPELTPEAGGHR